MHSLSGQAESPSVDDQAIGSGRDARRFAVLEPSRQNQLRKRILHGSLDDSLQRACAISGIVTAIREPDSRLVVDIERDLAIIQQLLQPLELNFDNRAHLVTPQAMEEEDIVDPVQELRAEMRAHHSP